MDGAIGEWVCERCVDQTVLLDERAPVERLTRHRDVKVVAAAGPVDDVESFRVGERLFQKGPERADSHFAIVAVCP